MNDATIAAMTEHLQAQGETIDPAAIRAFVAEKEHGESEAAFVADAIKAACAGEGKKMLKQAGLVTLLGAVAGPVVDAARGNRPAWREFVKRSQKTAALGALSGAATGLAVELLQAHRHSGDVAATVATIRRDAHAMEGAWAEITEQQTERQAAAPSGANSLLSR